MKNNKFLKTNIVMAISLLGLVAVFLVGIFWLPERMFAQQTNVAGSMYLEQKDAAKLYLYALFEEESEEKFAAGQQALSDYGFTGQGIRYVKDAMGITAVVLPVFAVGLAFLCMLLLAVRWKEKLKKQEYRLLEQKIAALKKEQTKEEYLQEQNKKIQNFIENIAHQIKTPISRVSSSLYLLEEEPDEEREQADSIRAERLRECQEHLESIRVLMKRLTDIGAMEAGKVLFRKEQIIIKELLQDAANSCQDGKRICITVKPEEDETVYHGDYEWLREAFVNLFNNALEHDKEHQQVEVSCVKNHDYYSIAVRDHGEGLEEADIPNLFDRFYLPEHAKTGHTGIGLNLARLIFEGHFGTIQAFNHEDGGAVFQILLPLYSLKEGKV